MDIFYQPAPDVDGFDKQVRIIAGMLLARE